MNIKMPIVTSNEKMSITQMITGEYLYKSGWIYNFMSTLHRDKKKILFDEYKFFWKYGIFLKRYFEIPINDLYNDMENFLDKYINKNYFIICYLDVREGKHNKEKCILFYNTEVTQSETIYSCCEWKGNTINFLRGTIPELVKILKISDLPLMRCDLLLEVKQENYEFSVELLKQELCKGKKLSLLDKMAILLLNEQDIEENLTVLQEWMAMYKERMNFINYQSREIDLCMERFDRIVKEDISVREKVIRLATLYNKLTKYIRGVIENL